MINFGDEVEYRGLPSAVGADQADELALAERKVHGFDGTEAAKMDGGLGRFGAEVETLILRERR